MTIEFKLPELGEGVENADVAQLFVAEGDEIQADQSVMELETEKAVTDLSCPHAGKITKLYVSQGDTIEVGQTLLTIEPVDAPQRKDESAADNERDDDESVGEKRKEPKEKTKREKPKKAESKRKATKPAASKAESDGAKENDGEQGDDALQRSGSPIPAGPATRRLARILGVDLAELKPSERGRIRQEDVVHAYVGAGGITAPTPELPDFERFGPVERQPLNKVARTSAERLSASWRTVPHVTQHGLADITELESARRNYAAESADDESRPKLTLTALAIKAVVGILKKMPRFNASLDVDRGELAVKQYFHIGVAVDSDRGLLVPVVRDADGKSLLEIAADVERLAAKARDGKLAQDEMQGGTFTISNQGGLGGGHFTPLVNWPEVAILGIGRAATQLDLHDGKPRERIKLPLSLSYDHRAINGADAARFMKLLEDSLSGPFGLVL